MLDNGRVAIVHEWASAKAGAEQVFVRMAKSFPEADLYALTVADGVLPADLEVQTTFLQRTGFMRERRALTLPIMPLAWKALRTPAEPYDTLVTSSHCFVRCFPARARRHFCYVHAPMRYAWSAEIDQRASGRLLGPARSLLRRLDVRTTRTVTHFAANSVDTQQKIARFYGRASTVIHPPVDIARFRPTHAARHGFVLGFSRWVPYKRLDLVIDVGERLGLPVVIAGRGPAKQELAARAAAATVPVRLVESPTDEQVVELYQTCELLVFPAVEDFGIVPVEAQACGTTVVALDQGGARDTVRHGATGVLAATQTTDAFARAARDALALGDRSSACVEHASQFSVERFDRELTSWIASG